MKKKSLETDRWKDRHKADYQERHQADKGIYREATLLKIRVNLLTQNHRVQHILEKGRVLNLLLNIHMYIDQVDSGGLSIELGVWGSI